MRKSTVKVRKSIATITPLYDAAVKEEEENEAKAKAKAKATTTRSAEIPLSQQNYHHDSHGYFSRPWSLLRAVAAAAVNQEIIGNAVLWCLRHSLLLGCIILLLCSFLPNNTYLPLTMNLDPPFVFIIFSIRAVIIQILSLLAQQEMIWNHIFLPLIHWYLLTLLFVVRNITAICAILLIVLSLAPKEFFFITLDPQIMLLILGVWYFIKSIWEALPNWLLKKIEENATTTTNTNSSIGGKQQRQRQRQRQQSTFNSNNENDNGSAASSTSSSESSSFLYPGGTSSPSLRFRELEDITNPTTIWRKLKEVFDLFYKISGDVPLPSYKMRVCFISLLHLIKELYIAEPGWHDRTMRMDEGSTMVELKDLKILQVYMEFATLAYNESCLDVTKKLKSMKTNNNDDNNNNNNNDSTDANTKRGNKNNGKKGNNKSKNNKEEDSQNGNNHDNQEQDSGYELLRHDIVTEPGRVGHFIAVHHGKKEVVIAIKGTSSLSDILTDLVGKPVPHILPDGTEIRCHEGMYKAAIVMLNDTRHLIQHFFVPLGYKVILCGHSLGAGVSSLLAVLLYHSLGIPVQVYAFATPVCLSFNASMNCQHYITSVVNHKDIVPRLGLATIRSLLKVFMAIDQRLTELNRSPNDWKSAAAFFMDIAKIDADTIMTSTELMDIVNKAREEEIKDEDYALFVPGRVVIMWECDNDDKMEITKIIAGDAGAKVESENLSTETNVGNDGDSNKNDDDGILSDTCGKNDTSHNDDDDDDDDDDGCKKEIKTKEENDNDDDNDDNDIEVDCRQLHGGLVTLSHIEGSTTMFTDHSTQNYEKNLALLIKKFSKA